MDSTKATKSSVEEQIQIIAQTIEGYMQEIEKLKEKITPTTLLEVTTEREQ
jgi:predicted  nucleic acid-binding Zn-ribbon protein